MGTLDWGKVEEMRERWEGGETQSALSVRFGVSLNTVGKVVKGQSWRRGGEEGRLERLLEVQARVEGGEADEILARVLKVQEERERREVPVGLLDGGEGDGGEGSGLAKLARTWKEMRDEGTL